MIIFTDLDDSLFQTERKCPQDTNLFIAAMDGNDQPLSYFTPQQRVLLALLQQGTLIPVTGRNSIALARVQVSFSSYRVTSHGAMILGEDGNPVEEWLAAHRAQYEQWLLLMKDALVWLQEVITGHRLEVRCRIIEDQGLPVYVSIKGHETALQVLKKIIHRVWRGDGAQVHHNGHNMALLPPFASKERAVKFLMTRLSREVVSPLFIGLGDSITDLPFLRQCHYAIIPCQSQLQKLMETSPKSDFSLLQE